MATAMKMRLMKSESRIDPLCMLCVQTPQRSGAFRAGGWRGGTKTMRKRLSVDTVEGTVGG
jgi:hypothetical protein